MVKNRKRIVFFATQLYPLAAGKSSGYGGAETELWNVAQQMATNPEYDVRALTLSTEASDPVQFGSLVLYPVKPAGPLTYEASWLKRRFVIISYFIRLIVRASRQKGQIYFAKLASSEASAIWLAAQIARGKFVYRVEHDWETNLPDLQNIIFRGSRIWSKVFLYCLTRADLVVVQTRKQAEALKSNFKIESVLIPNGHIIPDREEIKHRPEERPNVLWIARCHPMKRPHLFLQLAQNHPHIPFQMIMAPDPDHQALFDTCREKAAKLSNVHFIDGVASSEINTYYRSARLFTLTSEAEGFSNVVIEALKNGAPVLTLDHNPDNILTSLSTASDISGAAGFCTNNDLELTSELIQLIFGNDSFWTECHHKAMDLAESVFSMHHVVGLYDQQFKSLDSKQ